MHILEKIVKYKREEVAIRKLDKSIGLLTQSPYFESKCLSFKKYLTAPELSGVIAEFKRKSPSKGIINGEAKVKDVALGYAKAGVSCMSVLTDNEFFGGSNDDLKAARMTLMNPILRKDFVVDEYQIFEAKAIGADAVLLIAACLTQNEVKKFSALAQSLGLQVLLEVHTEEEVGHYCETVDMIGVNNRNLKDFTVSVDFSHNLLPKLPWAAVKISESGINDPQVAANLQIAGFDGLLIGESFMKTTQPEIACAEFITTLQKHKLQTAS